LYLSDYSSLRGKKRSDDAYELIKVIRADLFERGLTIHPARIKCGAAIMASRLERVINFSPLFSRDYSSSRSTFVF